MKFIGLYNVLETVGTVAFSISGAVTGIKKRMDWFGIIVLAVITAIGGGVLRDVLVGAVPPQSFRNPRNVLISVLTAVVFIGIHYLRGRLHNAPFNRLYARILFTSDALGLGIFTMLGINMGIELGYESGFTLLILLGVLTGAGGGMLRDILANEIPGILTKQIYAVASIIGGICFLGLRLYMDHEYSMLAGVAVIVGIRVLAAKKRLNLPVVDTKR